MPGLVRDSERESDLGTPPFGFSFLLGTLVPFVRVSQVAYIEIFNSIFKRESFLEVRPGSTKNNMPTEKTPAAFDHLLYLGQCRRLNSAWPERNLLKLGTLGDLDSNLGFSVI